ncbi:MAG: aspartyl protease family protein [Candidatus Cybelea sp.]
MIKRRGATLAIILLTATSSAHAQNDPAPALFQSGDFPAAAAAYQGLLQTHPSNVAAQLGLAAIRLYQNDLAAAEPLLRSVLAAQPNDARAARLMTELHRRTAEAARPTNVTGDASIVPFVTADPLPVVRGVANGIAGNFIIDTGADVVLEPAFAAKIGVRTTSAGTGVFAGGQRAAIRSGMLASFALANATARDVPVHVLPTHASGLFPGLHVDGIVGTTYFERFLATIDYPNRRLILRMRSPSRSAEFQRSAAAAHAAIVPCYLVGDHFVVAQAQVNQAAAGLFLFDSGLAGGGIMPSADLLKAAAIPLDQAHASAGVGGGGAVMGVPFVAGRVAVGSAVQNAVPGIYTPQGSPFTIFPFTLWGALSNEFLRHYAFTVDFDAMTIVLAPPSPAAGAPRLSPQQIFDASFRRLQSYPVPPYAVWTATWNIHARPMGYYTGEKSSIEVSRYAVRLSDGLENVSNPSADGKLPPAIIEPEFLGPFAWRMRSSVRVAPADHGVMMQPDVAGLKTIATVVAIATAPYAIGRTTESVPIEDVNGHSAYHLELHPRSDPGRHNLRDLWIDVHTFDVWKAHFVGTYAPLPQARVSPTDVTVYFRNVLGCWVVTRAAWTWDDPPMSFQFDVQNDEIGLPAALPDWLFDAAQYRRHQSAGESDYLGTLLQRMRGAASPTPSPTGGPTRNSYS